MAEAEHSPPQHGLALMARWAQPLSSRSFHSQPVPSNTYFQQLRAGFEALLEIAFHRSNASQPDIRLVRRATGVRCKTRPFSALMSHMPLRQLAGEALNLQLKSIFEADAHHSWWFGTFITDLGNTGEYRSIVELGRLKRDAVKMAGLVGLESIGVVETQLARYPLAGHGRTLQAHIHLIGRALKADFDAAAARHAIARSSTFTNWLGAPTATFMPIRNASNLAFRCNYMFKAPLDESWLVRNPAMRSGFEMKSQGMVDPLGALRLAELLSHMDLRGSTFAQGSLVVVKGDWIRDVTAWQRSRLGKAEPEPAAFQRVWDGLATKITRESPDVRRDASCSLDDAWAQSMARWFDKVATNQARFDAWQARRRMR